MSQFNVAELVGKLTLEEKASLVSGAGFWHTREMPQLGVPSLTLSDGPHGLRKQERSDEQIGLSESLPATCFPTACALGSSFDVDLVTRVGAALGREALAQHVEVVLGPGINIKRSPLCGRNFEYFSEDPLVAGELGGAMVRGIQSQGVAASLKHFAANNQETDRLRINALVDVRTLREMYLSAFERVVRMNSPWTVMCSYNRVNGVYASQHHWLLTEVLRHEWNFDGLVMSDWGAVDDAVSALAAGLDLEMPSSNGVGAQQIVAAVRADRISEETLDVAIGRLVGLIERTSSPALTGVPFSTDEHHDLAREVASQCIVLLKNEHSTLPLGENLHRVGVIGEFARSPRFQGAGSSKVNPTRVDNALGALRERLGDQVTVEFAAGFGVDDALTDDIALREAAVSVARRADVALVFLGLPASSESEGFDRVHLDLPASQLQLLEAVRAVNSHVVVVLSNGGVVETSSWQHHADAILEAWLGGQASGAAIVDVLIGDVNPSARLTETIPLRLADTPAFINFPGEDGEVRYGEGIFVGYRYYDVAERPVSYPFGHGLSYTTFEYGDLELTELLEDEEAGHSLDWRGPKRLLVSVNVRNVGCRAGKEVVQLYVGGVARRSEDCVRELKSFKKISLEVGASESVQFTLHHRDFCAWSLRANDWVSRSGTWEVSVGASSRDVRLRSAFVLSESSPTLPLNRLSTVEEWMEHSLGSQALLAAIGASSSPELATMLGDRDIMRVVGSFPLARIATMTGSLDKDFVDQLLELVGDHAAREERAV